MKTRPTQCVPSRRSRRYGRAALSRAALSRAALSRVALSVAALALAASSRLAAGTAPAAGAAPSVTDVAFHDGADVPIQALAFFPVGGAERGPRPARRRARARADGQPSRGSTGRAATEGAGRSARARAAPRRRGLRGRAPRDRSGFERRRGLDAARRRRGDCGAAHHLAARTAAARRRSTPRRRGSAAAFCRGRERGRRAGGGARGIRASGALDRPHHAAPDPRCRSGAGGKANRSAPNRRAGCARRAGSVGHDRRPRPAGHGRDRTDSAPRAGGAGQRGGAAPRLQHRASPPRRPARTSGFRGRLCRRPRGAAGR